MDCIFGYTGRPTSKATGLQNNLNRWYEAITHKWLSEDPSGFGGGDANLYRYCRNGATNGVDPRGLEQPANWFGNYSYVVGPKDVSDTRGKVTYVVYVHYVTDWFTTDIGNDNDHLIGEKAISVCPKDAKKAYLLLNDWANSLTGELDAMSYTQALEQAESMLETVEKVLLAKLAGGDYDNPCEPPTPPSSCEEAPEEPEMQQQQSQQQQAQGEPVPERVTNPKHNPNSASPEPSNAQELFNRSIVDNKGVRWTKDADGVIHRFSAPSNGQSHWNGSTTGVKPIRMDDIPIAIRRALQ